MHMHIYISTASIHALPGGASIDSFSLPFFLPRSSAGNGHIHPNPTNLSHSEGADIQWLVANGPEGAFPFLPLITYRMSEETEEIGSLGWVIGLSG